MFALSVAGCGGGGGGSTSAVPAAGAASSGVTLTFTIPSGTSTSTSSGSRRAQSVPSSSQGIVLYAYAAGGTQPTTPALVGDLDVPPNVPGNKQLCTNGTGGRSCSITFTAPAGADIIAVQLYDTEPSGGTMPTSANLLASGSVQTSISANGSNPVSLTINSVTATIGATGGTIGTFTPTNTGSVTGGSIGFSIPSGAVPGNVQVGVSEVLTLMIPLSNQRKPQFTQGAGNTFVYGFAVTFSPTTTLRSPLGINATFQVAGTLASALSSSGTLNVAQWTGSTYGDVGNASYTYSSSSGTLTISGTSTGVVTSGIYILYVPAPGTAYTPPRVGSSGANATGALAVLTISGTTYAFVPTALGLQEVPLTSGNALITTANAVRHAQNTASQPSVDACSADATHLKVYCVSFGGDTNIYAFDVSSGSVGSFTTIPTDAGSQSAISFSGGSCLLCGIVYDSGGSGNGNVIVSVPTGYEVYNVSNTSGTPTLFVAAAIAENFGFNTATRLIFSPEYQNYGESQSIDMISIAGGGGWYTLASQPAGLYAPDHGAIDTSLNVAVTSEEYNTSTSVPMYLVPLGNISSLPTATSGSRTSISGLSATTVTVNANFICPYATDGIAVDSSAHLAFFASEWCAGEAMIGVATITSSPSLNLTGANFVAMPSLPTGSPFDDNHDPHALTVFDLPNVCAHCAVISNLEKTYVAVIDLNQLQSTSGTNLTTGSSGADPNPVITYLPISACSETTCETAAARKTTGQPIRRPQ